MANVRRLVVIPAKAGNQDPNTVTAALDPRFRGGDEMEISI